ncbi:bifunctional acetate--CoA ligase family protein/GNAT family N-acetyltransferase [Salinisphaera aquimarina]|uniref:GNAT family N-acetyltransferase n=1 Tax=Salinisphaera aquimarina TaxID=2094031 RepID=A0ABV7EPE1_9GAMM
MTLRNIDALFHGDRVLVLGEARSHAQRQLLANIEASLPADKRRHLTRWRGAERVPDDGAELAVILDARWGQPKLITALGEQGCRAVLWCADERISNEVLRAARPYNLRLLGGRSAGIVQTRSERNISTLAQAPRLGKVALITQSQSLAAAALDWALGRNIGFSWLACSGSEADIDIADLLDYAALDPRTRAVVLQVGRIRAPRKFISAARAVARVKPVLVLQTRRAIDGGPQGPDPARSAAFARAGLVECESLGGLFDGLAALELLPTVTHNRVAVLGNGSGVCALGTDALIRQGLEPARLGEATRQTLAREAPDASDHGVSIDLASSSTQHTLAALKTATEDTDNVDAVLFVHSPVAGQPHEPMVDAIAKAEISPRLMTVWLGLHTAQPARHSSALARLATFASADEAVRAVRYRAQYRFTRELLTATPPPDPSVTADVASLRERLEALSSDGVEWLSADEAAHLLTAYGIAGETPPETAVQVRVRALAHPELGMVMSVQDEAVGIAPAYGFAPLDALLARRMLQGASASRLRGTRAAFEALAQALVRLGKMIVDIPELAGFDLRVAVGPRGRLQSPADSLIEITGNPRPARERLAMSPYPARMRHIVTLKNERRFIVRAIRPSDEPAVLDLLESLSPEEIRLRFFNYIRHFSHDMAARITQVDYDREVSLVVSAYDTPDQLAGMGTIIADPDGNEAEFAILVHRNHAGIGLGRHLLDCLLRQAQARGIETVYGDVLAQNRPMLKLARGLGFKVRLSIDDASSVRVEIPMADYGSGSAA